MSDRTPALIVRCAGVADVLDALTVARSTGLPAAVRSGGHNVAGTAVCDGGIVIDLPPMKGMRVDPGASSVRAEAGVTWGEFDHETQAFGLATTGGLISSTGIAGLTLGGGLGWLMRRYSLACDNLVAADVVTADGRVVTASATENADLFWGLRGGGGNFGIVTSFTYRLYPVGPVLAGMVVYLLAHARAVLQYYCDYTLAAPDELTVHASLLTLPDVGPVVALLACYCGAVEHGAAVVRPLRAVGGQPLLDTIQPMAHTAFQSSLDAGSPPGLRNYWKASFVGDLNDGAVDTLLDGFSTVPLARSSVLVEGLGGAVARVNESSTAFSRRDAAFDVLIASVWDTPADDQPKALSH